MKTAEIISKVTMILSLIDSNNDFDFVGSVIKTPCLFYFRRVKFHYVEETQDVGSLWRRRKLLHTSAQKTTKEIFVKIC